MIYMLCYMLKISCAVSGDRRLEITTLSAVVNDHLCCRWVLVLLAQRRAAVSKAGIIGVCDDRGLNFVQRARGRCLLFLFAKQTPALQPKPEQTREVRAVQLTANK